MFSNLYSFLKLFYHSPLDFTDKQLISTIIQHFLITLTCVIPIIGDFLICRMAKSLHASALLKGRSSNPDHCEANVF